MVFIPKIIRFDSGESGYLKTYDAITNAESGVLELVEQMCQKYPQDSLFQFHVNRIRSGVISPLIVMEDK